MNGLRQTWLVAIREMRERGRSKAFRISVLIMIIAVVGVIVLPSLLTKGAHTKRVGLAGSTPAAFVSTLEAQGSAVGTTLRMRPFDAVAAGEDALRAGKIDVLIVNTDKLEWRRKTDDQLRSLILGAVQITSVRARAAAQGISPTALAGLLAPVQVDNIELGSTSGTSPGDETAALLMTVVLFIAISTYGGMVLSGVVEEKASRVVEVLLARMPARNLLAGKVAGIGLLGLGQITITALAALVATTTVSSVDVPSVRPIVMAWVVVWFVLGYVLYAMVFGALGALASRAEDAQAVAGPVTAVLVVGYFVSFAAIGSPDTVWARFVSWFPLTAPLSMPNRIAVGAASWWEPFGAVVLAVLAIAALVNLAGRVYAGAILHGGPSLKLRDVWKVAKGPEAGPKPVSGRDGPS